MLRRSGSRLLHDEHAATISTLDRVESVLLRGRSAPPEKSDAEAVRTVDRLSKALEAEAMSHFDYEEQALFPLLKERGEGDLAGLLLEEHAVMREVTAEILEIGKGAVANGFTNESWAAYRRLGGELSERLRSHIDKEEMALLPILEDLLDADLDAEIAAAHAY